MLQLISLVVLHFVSYRSLALYFVCIVVVYLHVELYQIVARKKIAVVDYEFGA